MMRYLLDANVLSEPTRELPRRQVMERLSHHYFISCTASVVWYELWRGMKRLPQSRRRDTLNAYLQGVAGHYPMLSYDQNAATWHAEEQARLESLGKIAPHIDGQIAAIAVVNDLILVTANTQDYENFVGLDLEDWTR